MTRLVRARSLALTATVALGAALLCGAAAIPALAQDAGIALPSYARPADSTAETIHGEVVSVRGPFHITVRDDRGFLDEIDLRPGTVIDPTGVRLAVGMTVRIEGYNGGSTFVATLVDTPYQYDGAAPEATYYGDGWWYPGYDYGYAPAFYLGYVGTQYLFPQPYVQPAQPISSHVRGFEHPVTAHHVFRATNVDPAGTLPPAGAATARALPGLRGQPPAGEPRSTVAQPVYRAPIAQPVYRAPVAQPAYRAPEVRAAPAPRAESRPAESRPAPAQPARRTQ